MVKYKIIDNFLSDSDFTELKNKISPVPVDDIFIPNQFNWVYVGKQVGQDKDTEHFEKLLDLGVFSNEHLGKVTNIEPSDSLHQWVFGHLFFLHGYQSPSMAILSKLLDRIQPLAVTRISANFTVQQEKRSRSLFHIDIGKEPFKNASMITSIFYVNTTNGPTILEDGTEIECRANRLVAYPHNTYHAGVLCTDQPYRIVINLNYFKDLEFSGEVDSWPWLK